MAIGECNCGAVAVEVTAELTDVYICHCSICRRASGNNGMAVIVVPNESVRWLRGENDIATWKKPDAHWQIWFCRTCGSALPGTNDEARMFIPAGMLTSGADKLRVAGHIYVDSKASWDQIGDSGHQYSEGIGDNEN